MFGIILDDHVDLRMLLYSTRLDFSEFKFVGESLAMARPKPELFSKEEQ